MREPKKFLKVKYYPYFVVQCSVSIFNLREDGVVKSLNEFRHMERIDTIHRCKMCSFK